MKSTEEFLSRVFTLARRVRPPLPGELPYGLETAVLAHWRAAAGERSGQGSIVRGLRWAALFACLLAFLAGLLGNDQVSAFRNRFDPESSVADSAVVSGYDYE
ncbi:MAG: hypothetical protein H0X40_01730 [Chthoniobacterales bacterium]|nr:hypothetical protein [Chthoniobacterales bacterium]